MVTAMAATSIPQFTNIETGQKNHVGVVFMFGYIRISFLNLSLV
jgi:hypothetical protein